MTERAIVVGDVHGCLQQLDELLRLVSYNPSNDRLIFAGDLVDRGPDPVGVVRRVRELGVECVLGNHEEKHIRWRKHELRRAATGKKNPMTFPPGRAEENAQLSDEEIAWMAGLPRFIRIDEKWLVVHAGVAADKPIEEQSDGVIRLRYVNEDGSTFDGDNLNPPKTVRPWAEVWRGPESVIYGHAVYSLTDPRIDNPAPDVWCYGIDTGCSFGGRLTAMLLPSREFVQVECPTRYARWRGEGDG